MIRKGLFIFFLFLVTTVTSYGQEREKLDKYIDSYLSMTPLQTDSIIVACDYLIRFSNDSLIKSHIAGYLFNKFQNSPIMGMESVAIYIAKNYFLNKKILWQGDDDMILLRLFVEFNENSLIGMKAPELNLIDTSGFTHSLHAMQSEYSVIFFFDTDCSQCKKEFPVLKDTIDKYSSFGVKVYGVYTQSDTNALKRFIRSEFSDNRYSDTWTFVWDPEFKSGFHKLYNVLKTPQMFLLDKEKKIIGRNLNPEALGQLLNSIIGNKETLSKNIDAFLTNYLRMFTMKDTVEMEGAIGPLFERTNQGNPELYRTMFLQLFDMLQLSDDTTYQNCAIFVADRYIIPKAELWWDNTIPLDYVPKMKERIIRNRIGSVANEFTFYTEKQKPVKIYDSKSKYTLLYFYSPKCAICKPFGMELEHIYKSLKKRGVNILAIDVESDKDSFVKNYKKSKTPWVRLYVHDEDKLDLYYKYRKEEVPMLYLLDKDKRIIAKKINTITLNKLIK